jgi:hypothetical protein
LQVSWRDPGKLLLDGQLAHDAQDRRLGNFQVQVRGVFVDGEPEEIVDLHAALAP